MSSPLKRRALAPLDANALAPSPTSTAKLASTTKVTTLSPKKSTPSKRAAPVSLASEAMSPAAKKLCVEACPSQDTEGDARSRSHSPVTSSVFDTSAGDGDASWATNATEDGDMDVAATRPAPVSLTRAQAREKAEILRLRLGLASYKLRTGQTAVPLKDLQVKPFLRPRAGEAAPGAVLPVQPAAGSGRADPNSDGTQEASNGLGNAKMADGATDQREKQAVPAPAARTSAPTTQQERLST